MTEPPSSKRRWLPLILLLVAPLLPLWRCLLFGESIGPFDQIRQFAPWNGPKPDKPWDVLQADGVLQFYVWRDLVFDAWGKGQLPFWNPYSLAGTPLLGNSQSAGFYPPHVLLGLLHVPTSFAMFLLAWAHLAWAGAGTFLLVRRLDGGRIGALLAGLMFMLSPFMIAWAALPSVIETVSWIPWVLAGIVTLFRRHPSTVESLEREGPDPKWERRSRRLRSRYAQATVVLAVSVAMMILAGHLQFVAYGFIAAFLLTFALCFTRLVEREGVDQGSIVMRRTPFSTMTVPSAAAKGLIVGRVVLCVIAGAAIAAPQLLTVLSYSQFSHRRTPPTAEGYAGSMASALKPYQLGTLPFSTLTGHPAQFPEASDEASGLPPVSSYFPQLLPGGSPFAETAIGIGPLALALLFLAPWRRSRRALAPIAVVGLVGLLLAMGTPLNAILYYGVPGWAATGSPGRVEAIFVLAACVLAGLALGQLPKLPSVGPKRFVPLLLPVVFVLIGVMLVQQYAADAGSAPLVSVVSGSALRQAGPGLLVALIVSAIALTSAYHLERRSSRLLVLAAPILLFLADGGLNLLRTGDSSFLKTSPLAVSDPNARIAVVNDPWGIPLAAPALAPPNTPAAARIHDLSGYDSLIHRDSLEMLRAIDGKDPAPPANGNMMFVKPSADPKRLAEAGVSEVWTRHEMPQLGQPTGNEGGVTRYAIQGPGRASTPAGPATIVRETATQLQVRATGPGRLVVRDRNMPGWMVKIDGKHAPIEGSLWREVDLPAGEHLVEFNYVPPGFMTGVYAAAVAILGLLGLLLATFFAKPFAPQAKPEGVESQ